MICFCIYACTYGPGTSDPFPPHLVTACVPVQKMNSKTLRLNINNSSNLSLPLTPYIHIYTHIYGHV